MHWLAHVLGLDSASGPVYLAYSGFASDLGELAIIGGLLGVLRKHQCSVRRCWRIGRHKVADHVCCARHTPGGAPTHRDVIDAHNAAKGRHGRPAMSHRR